MSSLQTYPKVKDDFDLIQTDRNVLRPGHLLSVCCSGLWVRTAALSYWLIHTVAFAKVIETSWRNPARLQVSTSSYLHTHARTLTHTHSHTQRDTYTHRQTHGHTTHTLTYTESWGHSGCRWPLRDLRAVLAWVWVTKYTQNTLTDLIQSEIPRVCP